MIKMQEDIKSGLRAININGNWLEKYEQWKKEVDNQFSSLLRITNPFDTSCSGDYYLFNESNPNHMTDLDIMKMSVFLSKQLNNLSRTTFDAIRCERNRYKKIEQIERYFDVVDQIVSSQELSGCIVTLKDAADKQMVLQGSNPVDLYVIFSSLRENLCKSSPESLYFLLTCWRITQNKKHLKELIDSLVDYIRTYFDDYNNDSEMHLDYSLDGLISIKKLVVVSHWLERIAIHTKEIFEKYKALDWICQVDRLADDIVGTNQISKYEMLQYKLIFANDDDETVKKKAICNHGYAIWIKTVDVMHITCDVYQVLYSFSDNALKKMNTTRAAILEQYDNMTKIRNYYTGIVFFHQVYYQLERKYFDSQVMNALEADAQIINEAVNDVLEFVEAISSDNIEGLMQAKQKYISRVKSFATEDQEEKLDQLSYKIAEKIRKEISRTGVYEALYASVADEFQQYSSELSRIPDIFTSLVSAEYLFKQYVENKEPREKFDYSCISIMYYISLEDFINKLIYMPYVRSVLSTVDKKVASSFNYKNNTDWKKYVSDYKRFWNNGVPKTFCEIGVLGYLFNEANNEDCFKEFLYDELNITDIEQVKNYGQKLKDLSSRRNAAAHGGNYLTYSDVCIDKSNVFDVVKKYRGMILELLEMVFPKKMIET